MSEEHSGGHTSYYTIKVTDPANLPEPYLAECIDIIEALNMDFAEGEAFKAIWRRAASRLGKKKSGQDPYGLYDAEKVEYFGGRMVVKSESKRRLSNA